jgi:hypothetical protein
MSRRKRHSLSAHILNIRLAATNMSSIRKRLSVLLRLVDILRQAAP